MKNAVLTKMLCPNFMVEKIRRKRLDENTGLVPGQVQICLLGDDNRSQCDDVTREQLCAARLSSIKSAHHPAALRSGHGRRRLLGPHLSNAYHYPCGMWLVEYTRACPICVDPGERRLNQLEEREAAVLRQAHSDSMRSCSRSLCPLTPTVDAPCYLDIIKVAPSATTKLRTVCVHPIQHKWWSPLSQPPY